MPSRMGPKSPRTIEVNGKRQTIAEWAAELGCSVTVIYRRLLLRWSEVEAVTVRVAANGGFAPRHGRVMSAEYAAWRAMKNRCKDTADPRYGGRGIRVCQRWNASFEAFLSDMGDRPSSGHSLDRIDNNGNYACGKCQDCTDSGVLKINCRWATLDVQGRNRHNIRYLEYAGKKIALLDCAKMFRLPAETIWRRVTKYKWSHEKALTTPLRHPGAKWHKRNVPVTFRGKTLLLSEWAKELGLKQRTLMARICRCRSDADVQRALEMPLQPNDFIKKEC